MSQHVPRRSEPEPDLGARLRLGATLAVVAALGLFFSQNLQTVELHFLWFDWDTRLIWALVASAAIGATGMFLTNTMFGRRKRATRTTTKG
ncbi:MAG: LapA family protein [Dehalococcoidia bacterium]|nr:LapA family protein [Dehalococcoidia bacterium]